MYYEKVFRALNSRGVRYVPRATADLDIAVAIDEKNLEKLFEVMEELGFKPRIPVSSQEFANPANIEKWKTEKK